MNENEKYIYKCRYCSQKLPADWVLRDIKRNVAGFVNDQFYDVCLRCEDKLKLTSKFKHSKEPPYCLIPRWGDIDEDIEKTETD